VGSVVERQHSPWCVLWPTELRVNIVVVHDPVINAQSSASRLLTGKKGIHAFCSSSVQHDDSYTSGLCRLNSGDWQHKLARKSENRTSSPGARGSKLEFLGEQVCRSLVTKPVAFGSKRSEINSISGLPLIDLQVEE
jgi:hypothetical protein